MEEKPKIYDSLERQKDTIPVYDSEDVSNSTSNETMETKSYHIEKPGNQSHSSEITQSTDITTNITIENENSLQTKGTEIEMSEPLEDYKVLTIDDDKWIQRIFTQYLSNWGFTNISAFDPFTGLSEAIKQKPILIFLDIYLPEVNGEVLIKFLKKLEFTQDIPIVIISGNLNKDLIKTTYHSGAAGFITKPFTQDTLFSKIKEVLPPAIYNRLIADGKINLAQIKKKPFTPM